MPAEHCDKCYKLAMCTQKTAARDLRKGRQYCFAPPLRGPCYKGVVFIGRAPNGWDIEFEAGELTCPARQDQIAQKWREQAGKPDTGEWRAKLRRSPFERTMRLTMNTIAERESADKTWPLEIGWANLYLLAPVGGNPGPRLCRKLIPTMAKILLHIFFEHDGWSPKAIVFITEPRSRDGKQRSIEWIERFVPRLGLDDCQLQPEGPIVATARLRGVPALITQRPDARNGTGLAEKLAGAIAERLVPVLKLPQIGCTGA